MKESTFFSLRCDLFFVQRWKRDWRKRADDRVQTVSRKADSLSRSRYSGCSPIASGQAESAWAEGDRNGECDCCTQLRES